MVLGMVQRYDHASYIMRIKLNTPKLQPKNPRWGNWLSRAFGRFGLRVLGWQFEGVVPDVDKAVIVAAPHTSTWDWPVGMFAIFSVGLKVYWLGKSEFVNGRFRPLLVWLGGIPVDRSASNGIVEQTAQQFGVREHFLLALAPEGTRKAVTRWKLGFYYIARAADVPILVVGLDYGRKKITISPPISPHQPLGSVVEQIADFYTPVRGKNHDRAALTAKQILGS